MKNIFRSCMRLCFFISVVLGAFFVAREWRKKIYRRNRSEPLSSNEALNEARVLEEQDVTATVKKGTFLNVRDVNTFVNTVNNSKLTGRQNVIYAIIRGKKIIEMSDLLPRIPGVTERTLRRDLLQLQSLGLIEKHGTTKSSTYVLKK